MPTARSPRARRPCSRAQETKVLPIPVSVPVTNQASLRLAFMDSVASRYSAEYVTGSPASLRSDSYRCSTSCQAARLSMPRRRRGPTVLAPIALSSRRMLCRFRPIQRQRFFEGVRRDAARPPKPAPRGWQDRENASRDRDRRCPVKASSSSPRVPGPTVAIASMPPGRRMRAASANACAGIAPLQRETGACQIHRIRAQRQVLQIRADPVIRASPRLRASPSIDGAKSMARTSARE